MRVSVLRHGFNFSSGSYEDITSHIANCNQAQASGQEACDKMGYAPGISSTDAFQKGASALVDSKLAGYWKSKKVRM